jgi:hypothetical protein
MWGGDVLGGQQASRWTLSFPFGSWSHQERETQSLEIKQNSPYRKKSWLGSSSGRALA